jgi:hypothetical protein
MTRTLALLARHEKLPETSSWKHNWSSIAIIESGTVNNVGRTLKSFTISVIIGQNKENPTHHCSIPEKRRRGSIE